MEVQIAGLVLNALGVIAIIVLGGGIMNGLQTMISLLKDKKPLLEIVTKHHEDGTISVTMENHGTVVEFSNMYIKIKNGSTWNFLSASKVFTNYLLTDLKVSRPTLVHVGDQIQAFEPLGPDHPPVKPLTDQERLEAQKKLMQGEFVEKLFPGKTAVIVNVPGRGIHSGDVDLAQIKSFLNAATLGVEYKGGGKEEFPLKF